MDTTSNALHPLIASSSDATKWSATVTGLLTSLSGVVMLIATVYHYPLTHDQLNNFIQEFAAATSAIITAAGMAYTVFGICRKAFIAVFLKGKTRTNTVVPTPVTPVSPETPVQ